MDNNDNKQPVKKKRKDLKAATHILKREALRRYREKLHRRMLEEKQLNQSVEQSTNNSDSLKNVFGSTSLANLDAQGGSTSKKHISPTSFKKSEMNKHGRGMVFHCMENTSLHN